MLGPCRSGGPPREESFGRGSTGAEGEDGAEERKRVGPNMAQLDERTDEEFRRLAIRRLKDKRDFQRHLLAYVLVNAFIVVIWAMTGSGFFWPIFLIILWGIGLVFHAWDVYRPEEPDEDRIRHEMESIRRRG
jgi:hypothetical protein